MATETMVSFKPLGNRVVVEPQEGEEQVTAAGSTFPTRPKRSPRREWW